MGRAVLCSWSLSEKASSAASLCCRAGGARVNTRGKTPPHEVTRYKAQPPSGTGTEWGWRWRLLRDYAGDVELAADHAPPTNKLNDSRGGGPVQERGSTTTSGPPRQSRGRTSAGGRRPLRRRSPCS